MIKDLSIIIPVYKAKKTLSIAVNSILRQKYKNKRPKIEIIISVDDQYRYEKIIKKQNNDIKINFTSTKKIGSGPGNARNKGILKSKGKYIGFLDADDTYSENFIEEMYNSVLDNNIVICPTHVYKNNFKIAEFLESNKKEFTISDISRIPCTFHPLLKKNLIEQYENNASQDIYNLALLLNKKPIKIVKNCFYKLNIWNESYTANKGFYHKVEGAYKYYQIKSINEKKNKIAKQFAIRRIINKKYEHWKIKNLNKGYYEFMVEYLK